MLNVVYSCDYNYALLVRVIIIVSPCLFVSLYVFVIFGCMLKIQCACACAVETITVWFCVFVVIVFVFL